MSSPTADDKSGDLGIGKSPVKKWVQFEEDEKQKNDSENSVSPTKSIGTERNGSGGGVKPVSVETPVVVPPVAGPGQYSGAVIATESVHVSLNRSVTSPGNDTTDTAINMRTVDLQNGKAASTGVIRQGFANGDIIVTLLPVNASMPWITPAKFRPELVPEELMAQGLTLTVEDYVNIMDLLVNDVRFSVYNICYKRVLVVWIFTAFVILLTLLFSGLTGLTLFGLGVMWLVFNAAAIFFCMWIKIKLNHNLERCMANVNKHLLKHKIILGLDDRGKISCHKVNLCFIYFDTADCVKKLQEVIEREEAEGRPVSQDEAPDKKRRQELVQRMDIDDQDIIIQGSNPTRLSRKQERAQMLLLRYSSRWVKLYVRQRLDLCVDQSHGTPPPRHCVSSRCPCQFIEEHLKYKPRDVYCGIGPPTDDPHFNMGLMY
ncbi:transmembrane protein 268-like isoform X1 [Macrosteles quadrilineatus]|uniref:transmembrane protein 268-like isoform X1 n=1 Tax=Macrosteles quadrilineatus TaxID=74068 RepID=UPI0023E2B4C1|nr:transmembrane protein 268-like isoform X1 [Macrosteles quadrilineatus]